MTTKRILTNNQQLLYLAECVRFAQAHVDFKPVYHLDEHGEELDDYMLDVMSDTIVQPSDDSLHGWVL